MSSKECKQKEKNISLNMQLEKLKDQIGAFHDHEIYAQILFPI